MADEIDARVSPSLDPETYRLMEGVNDETIKYVGCVVNAMNDAYQTVGALWDARKAADANPGWTEEQRVLNVGRVADKHMQRILKRMDLAQADLAANIAHTEAQLSEPLAQQAGLGSLNGEVRAHAKSLERPERTALINEAMESGDEGTLTAILGGQHFLSGLPKEDHDYFLWRYHSKRNPHLVARLDVMQRVREKLDRIGPIIHEQFAKPIGRKPEGLAALKAADDRANAALDIQPAA